MRSLVEPTLSDCELCGCSSFRAPSPALPVLLHTVCWQSLRIALHVWARRAVLATSWRARHARGTTSNEEPWKHAVLDLGWGELTA